MTPQVTFNARVNAAESRRQAWLHRQDWYRGR